MRSRFWRKLRVGFRWLRISAWLVVLSVLCALIWFNQIGLPKFLKTRLVAQLQEQGVKLEFTRMRLRYGLGIVVENVGITGTSISAAPTLSAAEIQVHLNFPALLHRRLQINGLDLRAGKIVWPVSATNALTLDDVRTGLRLGTNDTWSLDNFSAGFVGAKLAFSGAIQHAPELRDWKIFQGANTGAQPLQSQLKNFSDYLDRTHFEGAQFDLVVNGDARDPHSFITRIKISAPTVQTPWLNARDIDLDANLTAPANAPSNNNLAMGFWTNAQPFHLEWSMRLTQLKTEKLAVDSIACGGFWSAPKLVVTNLAVAIGGGRLGAGLSLNTETRRLTFTNFSSFDFHVLAPLLPEKIRSQLKNISWSKPPSLFADATFILPAWTNQEPDWRGEILPKLQIAGELDATNLTVNGTAIDTFKINFSHDNFTWNFPDLQISQAKTHLVLSAHEDDATKEFHANIRGLFDIETARPFLTASNVARGFAIVKLNEPVALDAVVSGRLDDYNSIAVAGHLAITNFGVRDEVFGDVATEVNYTNRVLEFLNPTMHTGAQMATADSVTLDFNQRLIFFTNAFSTADPYSVTRAIGPKTGVLVEPYRFFEPPTARVNGQIPLGDMHGGSEMTNVDMRFEIVQGGAFQWERLKTTAITGNLHWRGQTLSLTNVAADLYGGSGNGFAYFDFRVAHEGADYNFAVAVTNINVHALAADLESATNHLEGTLSGLLAVTNASTVQLQSWNGFGHARLRDGLLWDIPVFGIFSPILNSIASGLGSNRATEAAGKFVITNGVIFTDSLLIRSTMSRLEYVGTIDLNRNVNAHVTAQLLRNTWVVGPLVSTVLWPVSKLFEYRVTGPLNNPKSEPLYVLPRLLMVPLHPIRSLEEIIPGNDSFMNRPPGN